MSGFPCRSRAEFFHVSYSEKSLGCAAIALSVGEHGMAADLFCEELWLRWCCHGGLAAGDPDDAENGEGRDGGARDEDAVGVRAQVGRSELNAVVEEAEKVIGDDAFEDFAVSVTEADPKAVEFGSGEKGFTFGLEVAIEFADEIEGADAVEGNLLVLAVGREEIERVDLPEAGRIEVSPQGLAVHQRYNDLLMGRGWVTELQSYRFWRYFKSCR